MSKILVTGGSGFLGSHIADALTRTGHQVTLFDMYESKWKSDDQETVVGDILDQELLTKAVEGKDVIYHLAALADLNEAKTKPLETVQINILGTVKLLEAARLAGVKRVMFGSTVYVYSRHGGFYRCSKQACENYIEEYYNKYGLEYTILRYGSLYGTRTDNRNGVYRLLKQFMEESQVSYQGSEDDKREYIHVEDAAELSVKALEDDYSNKHLTLTGNDKLTISELFKMFGEILNKDVHVLYDKGLPGKSGHYAVTPYTFIPKLGRKVVLNEYVDMGQGIIQVVEMIHNQLNENREN
ncbi:MAG: NAD(P)-dependent oxidoreductase [Bacteroidota bacterium]